MSLFVLSDPHLSISVDKPMDIFGNRWQDSRRKIEKNWLAVVKDSDTVILPGDISWGLKTEEAREDLLFLDRLPGQKIIGKGNHDLWWNTQKKNEEFFKENGINTISMLFNNAYTVGNKLIVGTRGWWIDKDASPKNTDFDKISAREAGRLELSIKYGYELCGERFSDYEMLAFFHFPPVFKGTVCDRIIGVLKKYGIKRCWFGHIHGVYNVPSSFEYKGIEFCISSADYLNFVPQKVF